MTTPIEEAKALADSLRRYVADMQAVDDISRQWLIDAKSYQAGVEKGLAVHQSLMDQLTAHRPLLQRIIVATKGKLQRADEAIERLERGF